MSTAEIRLTSAADIVSVVPHMLGFHPSTALVLVCLHQEGDRTRLGMMARVDMPPAGLASDVADALLPTVAREDPDTALVIGYSSDGGRDDMLAVEALADALREVGVGVRERLMVVQGQWRSLTSSDRQAWVDVPGPESAAALDFALATGSSPAASRAVLEDRCAAGARAAAVGRECLRLINTPGAVSVEHGAAAWGWLMRDRPYPHRFTDRTVALAAVALHAGGRPDLRDALIAWLVPGVVPLDAMDRAAVAGLRHHLPLPWWDIPLRENVPSDPCRVHADRPATYARLVDTLIQVVGRLPDQYAAPSLTVLAHVGWHQGNGAVARVALDRARAVDPGYRLAALMDVLISEGSRPRPP